MRPRPREFGVNREFPAKKVKGGQDGVDDEAERSCPRVMEKEFKRLAEKLCQERACQIQACLQGEGVIFEARLV